MNMLHRVVLLFFLLPLASCEQIIDTPDWPVHEEKLVVTTSLIIRGDSVFAYGRVGRTQPLDQPFDPSAASILDADVQLINGARTIDLLPVPLVPKTYPHSYHYLGITRLGDDDTYRLRVRHDGKTATSAFRLSSRDLRFTGVRLVDRELHGFAHELFYKIPAPEADTFLRCDLDIWSPEFQFWSNTSSVWLPQQANRDNGIIEGSFRVYPRWHDGETPAKPRFRYILTAVNRAYREYHNLPPGSYMNDSPFDPPGKNPPFNVGGDGIGFFMYEIVGDPVEIQY